VAQGKILTNLFDKGGRTPIFSVPDNLPMKTYSAKSEEVKRAWWVIDAAGQPLGRVAEKAADLLRGKNKTIFTPHVDTGDFVVVLNASEVTVGGKKEVAKTYMSFSGYVGGHHTETFKARIVERHPELLIERAVRRDDLPHNKLERWISTKLKVYAGSEHPHVAQNPKTRLIFSRMSTSDPILATGRRKDIGRQPPHAVRHRCNQSEQAATLWTTLFQPLASEPDSPSFRRSRTPFTPTTSLLENDRRRDQRTGRSTPPGPQPRADSGGRNASLFAQAGGSSDPRPADEGTRKAPAQASTRQRFQFSKR